MSARQNKKRKGRSNVNNRERTVTTLTESSDTSFLVPTHTEEPAGGAVISSPFSLAASPSSAGSTTAFQMPQSSFGFQGQFGNFVGPGPLKSPSLQPQQQQKPISMPSFTPQTPLPPGRNDLEVLEKLKEMIKNGQHEYFRAIPQPAALASIYLGPNAQPQIPPRAEQIVSDKSPKATFDDSTQGKTSSGNTQIAPALSTGLNRRPQGDDNRDAGHLPSQISVSESQSDTNVLPSRDVPESPADFSPFLQTTQPSGLPAAINRYGTNDKIDITSSGRFPAVSHTGVDSSGMDGKSLTTSDGQSSPMDARADAHQDRRHPMRPQPSQPTKITESPQAAATQETSFVRRGTTTGLTPPWSLPFDGKDDLRGIRDDDKRLSSDRPVDNIVRSFGNNSGSRFNGARDQRFLDGERDRERDRFWERDRERDRRSDERGLDDRRSSIRRLSLEQRFEPRVPDVAHRLDQKHSAEDVLNTDRRRRSPSPPVRPGQPGDQSASEDRLALRVAAASSDRGNRTLPPERRVSGSGDRPAGPPTLPQSSGVNSKWSVSEDRGTRGNPSAVNKDDPTTLPLEERISRQPTLENRITPAGSRTELSRQATSIEERLPPTAPGTVNDIHVRPSLPADGRLPRQPPAVTGGHIHEHSRTPIGTRRSPPVDRLGRPGYVRPVTPVQDRAQISSNRSASYAEMPSARPLPRDVSRKTPSPPPLPLRIQPREYRGPPGRELSRERADGRPLGFRAEASRSFNDDRRPDIMDVDSPPRVTDGQAPYRRYPSPPPSGGDLGRDRGRDYYARFSPPRGDPPFDADPDRRYPSERRDWQAPPLYAGRRDWNGNDEYPPRRPWERNRSLERDRYDRDAPGQARDWELERDRPRHSFRSVSPAHSFDGSNQRSFGLRLTDEFPNPDVPGYPSREFERSRYPPPPEPSLPPYSRVRPRSPSPLAHRPPNIDDQRPPIKRGRDDAGPYNSFYSPPPHARTPPPSDYATRPVTPPTPAGGRIYDPRPEERNYPPSRERSTDPGSYPLSSYNRPPPTRSPPPPRIPLPSAFDRGPYGRADERRYKAPMPRPV